MRNRYLPNEERPIDWVILSVIVAIAVIVLWVALGQEPPDESGTIIDKRFEGRNNDDPVIIIRQKDGNVNDYGVSLREYYDLEVGEWYDPNQSVHAQ